MLGRMRYCDNNAVILENIRSHFVSTEKKIVFKLRIVAAS